MMTDPQLPPLIQTARLTLRLPRQSDADAVFAYASDPEVTIHMDWPTHTDIAHSRSFLEIVEERLAEGSEATWAITLSGDDHMIGLIGARHRGHKVDFGYVLARPYWGRGIATEATRAVIEEAFRLSDVMRVWATCSVHNHASRRVLEKAGLEREGILRNWNVRPQRGGVPDDSFSYSIVRSNA